MDTTNANYEQLAELVYQDIMRRSISKQQYARLCGVATIFLQEVLVPSRMKRRVTRIRTHKGKLGLLGSLVRLSKIVGYDSAAFVVMAGLPEPKGYEIDTYLTSSAKSNHLVEKRDEKEEEILETEITLEDLQCLAEITTRLSRPLNLGLVLEIIDRRNSKPESPDEEQ